MNITERFLKYVGYGTNSDEKSETCPSTPNQLVLGAAIAEELKALGLTDVEQDADGYVYGYLPGEGEALGLIAHMDTSPAVPAITLSPALSPTPAAYWSWALPPFPPPIIPSWRNTSARSLLSPMAPPCWAPMIKPVWRRSLPCASTCWLTPR